MIGWFYYFKMVYVFIGVIASICLNMFFMPKLEGRILSFNFDDSLFQLMKSIIPRNRTMISIWFSLMLDVFIWPIALFTFFYMDFHLNKLEAKNKLK